MEERHLSPKELEETRSLITELERELLLHPTPRLMERHKSLIDMITTYTRNTSTASILELGCSSGDFVEYLREQGYNAEGMDIDKKKIERSNKPYLHYGDCTRLDSVFGDRLFDLIIAASLFNIGTQVYHLFGDELDKRGVRVVRLSPEREKAALENMEQILKSAFSHLISGGFLMACNKFSQHDQIDFTQEIAERAGYVVIQLYRQEAILQKPLNK